MFANVTEKYEVVLEGGGAKRSRMSTVRRPIGQGCEHHFASICYRLIYGYESDMQLNDLLAKVASDWGYRQVSLP